MAEKRLKKNISFSEHERDIYDYLDSQKNASALIKRLVYNHMIIEQGLVAPITHTPIVTQGTVRQATDTIIETNDVEEETIEKENKDGVYVETKFSQEDLENIQNLPEL